MITTRIYNRDILGNNTLKREDYADVSYFSDWLNKLVNVLRYNLFTSTKNVINRLFDKESNQLVAALQNSYAVYLEYLQLRIFGMGLNMTHRCGPR